MVKPPSVVCLQHQLPTPDHKPNTRMVLQHILLTPKGALLTSPNWSVLGHPQLAPFHPRPRTGPEAQEALHPGRMTQVLLLVYHSSILRRFTGSPQTHRNCAT